MKQIFFILTFTLSIAASAAGLGKLLDSLIQKSTTSQPTPTAPKPTAPNPTAPKPIVQPIKK